MRTTLCRTITSWKIPEFDFVAANVERNVKVFEKFDLLRTQTNNLFLNDCTSSNDAVASGYETTIKRLPP